MQEHICLLATNHGENYTVLSPFSVENSTPSAVIIFFHASYCFKRIHNAACSEKKKQTLTATPKEIKWSMCLCVSVSHIHICMFECMYVN